MDNTYRMPVRWRPGATISCIGFRRTLVTAVVQFVMSRYVFTSILLVLFCGSVSAADYETVRQWTEGLASHIERDLRKNLEHPAYADQLVGLDRDSVARQISHLQASCLVEALIRLAEVHSVDLADIFVSPGSGLVFFELLPPDEAIKETANCASDAFTATGIDFDS